MRSQRHASEIESHRDLHVSKLEATAAELKALLDDAVGQLLDAQEQVCDQCFPPCLRSLGVTDTRHRVQRACEVADKSSDELEAALLKLSAAAEKSESDRDAELGTLTDAIAELRTQTATVEDVETLARCGRRLAMHLLRDANRCDSLLLW